MNVHTQIRRVVAASMLGLAVLSLPAAQAHAAPATPVGKDQCEAQGYVWSDQKGCANKSCKVIGGSFWVSPGTSTSINGKNYMCDGFTGQWVVLPKYRTAPSLQPDGEQSATNTQ